MVRKSLICANNVLILAMVRLLVSERVWDSPTKNTTTNGYRWLQ